VIELFDNPDNLSKWQPGFISKELLSGEQGQEGAQSKLRYQVGKREIAMIETIIRRNLPHEFSGTYQTKGVCNEVRNFFYEVSPNRTRWVVDNEFRFSGLMKIMALLMPAMFKNQSLRFMQRFKSFAEKES
jgi:hypothetical protein